MNIRLYMDVHIPYAVTSALRLRGLDVLTAQEDGAGQFSDAGLLDRATNRARILFSQDDDLLREATGAAAEWATLLWVDLRAPT